MKNTDTRATASESAAPPRLRLPLASADDVRRELSRLYREAKAGRRDVSDASKLANMLQILARLIETSVSVRAPHPDLPLEVAEVE